MAETPSSYLTLRWNEPLATELTATVQRGDADRLRRMLAKRPELARAWIVKDGEAAGWRTLLHLFPDWPGHRRNPQEIVAVLRDAGADLDARMEGPHGEAPLHWAASNDDVELVDALLDAGADINAPGSVIGGLGPIADAAAFGGQRAGLRLVERGAEVNIYQAAAFGLHDRVQAYLGADPPPDQERITTAFWAACGAGHQDVAEILLAEGADINWVGWGDQTALDNARVAEADELVVWLESHGARSAGPPSR
jgi:ankyrin repeat protein